MESNKVIYTVTREFLNSDVTAARELVFRAVMSTWKSVYLRALLHELTYQFAIMLAALLFILVGIPLQYCILSVPVTLILLWVYVYGSHAFHAMETQLQIRQPSDDKTGTWVCEAYEPWFHTSAKKNVVLWNPSRINDTPELRDRKKRIVGVAMVVRHKEKANVAWIRRLAVAEEYQSCGIGTALIDTAARFCYDKGYASMQCAISEYQTAAKSFLQNRQFQLESIYSQEVLASLATFNCYIFLRDLLYTESRLNA